MNMRVLIIISFLFLFNACSSKSPINQWKIKSSKAFDSYKKNFFSSNVALAESDFETSIRYAKQGGDIEYLASVLLGDCALQISIDGDKKSCHKYKELSMLFDNKRLHSYYHMLTNQPLNIKYLPKKYKTFIDLKQQKKYDLAFENLIQMKSISSSIIAASLMKKQLQKDQIVLLMEKASLYGYKRLVIYWLRYLNSIEINKEEKAKLEKKIDILLEK